MKVRALTPDVLVATSAVWQTSCTIVRGGDEAFVIDSPLLPEELDVLPAVLQQAGWSFSGLLATHADWDHLLGRLAFPDAPLGVAETSAARLKGAMGEAARKLRDFDAKWYLERPRPLSLGQVEALPVPGKVEMGDGLDLELHPADGHTEDGMAVWVPWARVLVCGDFLSTVEVPLPGAGSGARDAYLATLGRLKPLVEQADWVVPGHGQPMDAQRALAILREDLAYVRDGVKPLARTAGLQGSAGLDA